MQVTSAQSLVEFFPKLSVDSDLYSDNRFEFYSWGAIASSSIIEDTNSATIAFISSLTHHSCSLKSRYFFD
jgi:hypothetical protein